MNLSLKDLSSLKPYTISIIRRSLPSFRSILNRKCSTAWFALLFEPISSFFSSSGSILCFRSEILSFFLLLPCLRRELLGFGDLNFCPRSKSQQTKFAIIQTPISGISLIKKDKIIIKYFKIF